ncbi:MAG: hypothetical protein J6X86_06800 [Bacteroidales bacterium]|nr:hypothetical protein [Bacteroidales bacterium]
MTRRLTLFSLTLLLLVACDPGFDQDYTVSNKSGFDVTLTPSGYYCYRSDFNAEFDTIRYQPLIIASLTDTAIYHDGGIGAADFIMAKYWMQNYLGDSVTLAFSDGTAITYYSNDTTGISPYNFTSPCYTWEEKVGEPYAGHVYYGKITFNISDGHHQAALSKKGDLQ